MESRAARILLRAATYVVLGFLYVPLLVIVIYAFANTRGQTWPPDGFTTEWFSVAFRNHAVRSALWLSLKAGLGATALALLLGTAAAFAVHRFRFFGRETIAFVLVLPIALPGIVTGLALSSAITFGGQVFGLSFGLLTIIVGHATFCVVVVYNNVVARLRRMQSSMVEASMDLGADGWQTFRYVTLPSMSTALMAGGLLAFALSFDEIVVTTFTSGAQTTLPIWIFNQLRLPRTQPAVNVVAMAVILLSIVPVYLAQRLTSETGGALPGAARERNV
ncbi:MAG TPA: ABC transporter permease [Actinomycetota bacterium]|jgi:putative spermidine/putrescine transport system permease protein